MRIARTYYLNQLMAGKHNGMIKIVTGLRRSGKSFLLFELFYDHLIAQGISKNHIIKVAFDDMRNVELRDPLKFLSYIDSLLTEDGMYYILLDEVQMLENFVDVMNSLLHMRYVDVYVTGSNSRFLSKDIATEFRGRGDETHLFPLSFAEYYSAVGGERLGCLRTYFKYGGLPQHLAIGDVGKKEDFLRSLSHSVYLKDILERHRIKNQTELEELMMVLSSQVGSPCNPTKLSNTFHSVKGIKISNKTIAKYLDYMDDAFLVERAYRYDVKGKRYINTLSKYYFQDIGLRNALIDFRQTDSSHIMENVIYNELRSRGYRVDVGLVEIRSTNKMCQTIRKQLEVDFVVNRGDNRFYIQSALEMPTPEKVDQETASLKQIKDAFKKIIIVNQDVMPYKDDNGFIIIGLIDFLLDKDSTLWK